MAEPFNFHDGTQVHSVSQLLHHIEADHTKYSSHVHSHNNDFANWVEGSLKLPLLAHQLKESRTREETIAALRSYLKHTAPAHAVTGKAVAHEHVFVSGLSIGIVVGMVLAYVIQRIFL